MKNGQLQVGVILGPSRLPGNADEIYTKQHIEQPHPAMQQPVPQAPCMPQQLETADPPSQVITRRGHDSHPPQQVEFEEEQ